MQLISKDKIKTIQGLFRQTNLVSQKINILAGYGVEHTNELTETKGKALINYLRSQLPKTHDSANQMRRKVLAMAHKLRWEHEDGTVNMQSVNNWCINRSYLKKELNDYTYDELPKLVSEFQQMYKSYIRSNKL